MSSTHTYAYLYKWTQLSTGMWYIGSRTAKGCHPDDGYICSSKIVKPLIVENTDDWQREILCVGAPRYIRTLEGLILSFLDAKSDCNSYNLNNADAKFSTQGTHHTDEWKRTNGIRTAERNRKMVEEGVHVFVQENNPSARRVKEGTHHFLADSYLRKSLDEAQRERVRAGSHHWKSPEHAQATSTRTKEAIASGNHPFGQMVTCPHCGKTGPRASLARWHFDNCRYRLMCAKS